MQCKDLPAASVLRAVQQSWVVREQPYVEGEPRSAADFLAEYPAKVVWQKMQRLCDARLLEYGTSIGTAWLTPEGEALLAAAPAE